MSFPFKKTLYILLTVAILGGVGWYTYTQSQSLIEGPRISVTNPANGSTVAQPEVEITGNTENVSHISINDRPIFVDDTGHFAEFLLLLPGYNIIEITAQDRFERNITKKIELVLRPQPAIN